MARRSKRVAIVSGLLIVALVTFHPAPASAAPIQFEIHVLDDPGKGFNDPILGAQRLSAFEFAANRWGPRRGSLSPRLDHRAPGT